MSRVLIMGANRGIGLEMVKQYASRGDQVYALCRQASNELRSLGNVQILENCEVGEDSLVEKILKSDVLPENLDVVIANAGIVAPTNFKSLSNTDSVLHQYNINAVGPLRLARGVQPRMIKGSKFGIVTGAIGSIGETKFGGYYGYKMSKTAANSAGKVISMDWKTRPGVAVAMIHPGYVRTEMTKGKGLIDPPEGAANVISIMDNLELKKSGRFWNNDGTNIPW